MVRGRSMRSMTVVVAERSSEVRSVVGAEVEVVEVEEAEEEVDGPLLSDNADSTDERSPFAPFFTLPAFLRSYSARTAACTLSQASFRSRLPDQWCQVFSVVVYTSAVRSCDRRGEMGE